MAPPRVPHDPAARAPRTRLTRRRRARTRSGPPRPTTPAASPSRGRPAAAQGRARVVVTMGTLMPGRLETMIAILDGLEGLDVDIVATVGHDLDPAALGTRRPTTRVARYVPMTPLLAGSSPARLPRGVRDDARGPRGGRAAPGAAGGRGPAGERRAVRRRRGRPRCWPPTTGSRGGSARPPRTCSPIPRVARR